jgi:hypothetical protein
MEKIAALFCMDNGRPTKSLRTMTGLMIIQECFNLTDRQILNKPAFDQEVHCALKITEDSDENNMVSPRICISFRHRIIAAGLPDVIFNSVTVGLANSLQLGCATVRQDSVHIKSNMKSLSRGAIIHPAIVKFLKSLEKSNKEAFTSVSPGIVGRNLGKSRDKTGCDCFGSVPPARREKAPARLARDMSRLVMQLRRDRAVRSMQPCSAMKRVLKDQRVTGECGGAKARLKPDREIPSNSVQNPSDPDAEVSGHKGQGYSVRPV